MNKNGRKETKVRKNAGGKSMTEKQKLEDMKTGIRIINAATESLYCTAGDYIFNMLNDTGLLSDDMTNDEISAAAEKVLRVHIAEIHKVFKRNITATHAAVNIVADKAKHWLYEDND